VLKSVEGGDVVGDGTYLKMSEALTRLRPRGYSADRVRQLADAGYLRSTRPPATGLRQGTPHRRIEAASLDEYEAALNLPQAARDVELEAMRARNLAQMGIAGVAHPPADE
jgi:hypothetical protein